MSNEDFESPGALAPRPGSAAGLRTTPSPARIWTFALIAATAAGVFSWLGGEAAYEFFKPAYHEVFMYSKVMQIDPVSEATTDVKNAALAFAIHGGVLALLLGFAGGLAARRREPGLMAGGMGFVLGAAVAIGATSVTVRAFQRYYEVSTTDLLAPLPYHIGTWSAVGAMAGLALGLGIGGGSRVVRGLIGGAFGGLVGAIFYQLGGAAAFPLDRVFQPLSTSAYSRLLARMLSALSITAGAVLALQMVSSRKARSTAKPAAPAGDADLIA
jgi:hypothetical protein